MAALPETKRKLLLCAELRIEMDVLKFRIAPLLQELRRVSPNFDVFIKRGRTFIRVHSIQRVGSNVLYCRIFKTFKTKLLQNY